nr:helix-turn-helix transcriptional regulator [Phascolarctobacterium succinatutens]
MEREEKRALVREVIKRTRKCKDMTQSDLAKAVSVATATIGFWESGVIKSIRKVNRNAVAEALGIDKRLLSYNPDSTALQQSYLEKFANSKKNFDLQLLPDLLVVTGNDSDRTYDSSTASGPNVMGYINSLQERVQALEDKLQRIEKAFKGDNE